MGRTDRALVLARGLGSRMRADDPGVQLTADQQRAAEAGLKALMPIDGRPFLDYVLGVARRCRPAFRRPRDRAGRQSGAVRTTRGPHAEWRWTSSIQPEPRGTADAVLAAEGWAGGRAIPGAERRQPLPRAGAQAISSPSRNPACPFSTGTICSRRATSRRSASSRSRSLEVDDGVLTPHRREAVGCRHARRRRADAREHELLAIRRRIFSACRDVEPSPRGEFELPLAVGLALRRGVRFRAVPARGPVLDLSRRGRHRRSRASPARSTSRAVTDAATLAGHLVAAGLDEAERAAKAPAVPARARSLAAGCRIGSAAAWWVPGRLEVFGTHTDYAGGRIARRAGPARVRVPGAPVAPIARSAPSMRRTPGSLDNGRDPPESVAIRGQSPARFRGWRHYVEVTAARLARNFPAASSAPTSSSPAICPRAAGMSSSSALVVGIATALIVRRAAPRTPRVAGRTSARPSTKPDIWRCIENGRTFGALAGDAGVGTHGGSEDHAAMLAGTAGACSGFAFVPLRLVGDCVDAAGVDVRRGHRAASDRTRRAASEGPTIGCPTERRCCSICGIAARRRATLSALRSHRLSLRSRGCARSPSVRPCLTGAVRR